MRIGVIGGSGFIGSHLVDSLLRNDTYDVTIFDVMSPRRSDVRHVHVDITDLGSALVALAGGFDVLYLLAAVSDVNDVNLMPVESTFVNVMGAVHVLEAARRTGVGRVILASTTWVYSGVSQTDSPIGEETPIDILAVGHVYTATKVSAELLVHAYANLYQLPTTVLRYGIPYGPGARRGSVVANFVTNALAGEPLRINGSGKQRRNFIYIDDLIEGNVAALKTGATGGVFNLEGPQPVSVLEVAEAVRKVIGPEVVIEHIGDRAGDFSGQEADNSKALSQLGWKPQIEIHEGISRYVEWMRKNP